MSRRRTPGPLARWVAFILTTWGILPTNRGLQDR
jgi:hypothetical protein